MSGDEDDFRDEGDSRDTLPSLHLTLFTTFKSTFFFSSSSFYYYYSWSPVGVRESEESGSLIVPKKGQEYLGWVTGTDDEGLSKVSHSHVVNSKDGEDVTGGFRRCNSSLGSSDSSSIVLRLESDLLVSSFGFTKDLPCDFPYPSIPRTTEVPVPVVDPLPQVGPLVT